LIFSQVEKRSTIKLKTVIIATGFELFDPLKIPRYGYGKFKNVVTSMQMEGN